MQDTMNALEDPNRVRDVTIRLRSSFEDVREAALNTSGKKYMTQDHSPELAQAYFISEHSPIRSFDLRITLHNVYYPTSVHFARHVHSIPYVQSSRPDRTNKERSLDNGVEHMLDINAQGLIDMMRKRLCKGSCSQDTYLWAIAIKKNMASHIHPDIRALSTVLVPNCVYRGGGSLNCPEFRPCGAFNAHTGGLKERYAAFNSTM